MKTSLKQVTQCCYAQNPENFARIGDKHHAQCGCTTTYEQTGFRVDLESCQTGGIRCRMNRVEQLLVLVTIAGTKHDDLCADRSILGDFDDVRRLIEHRVVVADVQNGYKDLKSKGFWWNVAEFRRENSRNLNCTLKTEYLAFGDTFALNDQ
jgi:hypothetical protein